MTGKGKLDLEMSIDKIQGRKVERKSVRVFSTTGTNNVLALCSLQQADIVQEMIVFSTSDLPCDCKNGP